MTLNERVREMKKRLADTDINGCIVGSTMAVEWDYECDPSKPDIDVFVYSPYAMVHAIDVIEYRLGLVSGGDSINTDRGEAWKAAKCRINGRGQRDLATCKFTDGNVVVNVSNRKGERSAMDVLSRFDMSIVLRAYDIQSGTYIDMRRVHAKKDVADVIGFEGGDEMTAVPNPFRSFDGTVWDASKWLRQWERVIKYGNRGFDTLPMARFYLNMIKEVTEGGTMFKTEASRKAYEEFVAEFADLQHRIEAWIEEKE